MPPSKYVTETELKAALHKLRHELKEDLKEKIQDLHDDLVKHHFAAVLDAISHIAAGDTSVILERLMTLAGSVERLGAVTAKLVVDGKTTQDMIAALKAEIDRLVAQGSANQSELDALKATVANVEPALNAHVTELETLDAAVDDPAQPDLDPNTPVA